MQEPQLVPARKTQAISSALRSRRSNQKARQDGEFHDLLRSLAYDPAVAYIVSTTSQGPARLGSILRARHEAMRNFGEQSKSGASQFRRRPIALKG
jgi:hypothetical protein